MAQLSLVASLTSVSSPKAFASPSFTSSWPRFLKEFPIFGKCKPENHLSVPELSGSMSSTEGTRQPLGPALCSTTWQPRASYQVGLEAKATFAQTTFQRAQWVREANWETLSSLHSIEPTGLKRYQEVKRLTWVFKWEPDTGKSALHSLELEF